MINVPHAWRSIAAAIVVGCLGCCAPAGPWSRPGADEGELQRDLAQCAAQAAASSPQYFDARQMSVVSDPQDAVRQQRTCMIARGWQSTRASP